VIFKRMFNLAGASMQWIRELIGKAQRRCSETRPLDRFDNR
jgi:hypothetical protein